MAIVQMPDGSVVEFPEGTAPEVMERALRGFRAPAEQMPGAWAPTAAVRGIGDLVGLPRDLMDLRDQAINAGVGYLEDRGVPGVRRVAEGVRAVERLMPGMSGRGPTGEQVSGAIMDATGMEPVEPETTAGRIGAEALRFAAGSAVGGSMPAVARNALAGAVAGTASGGAGEATRGSAAEPFARAAGALAPAAVGGAARVVRGNPVRDAAAALDGVTPQQMEQAQALMRQAEQLGSPITLPEAVQQVAGPNRNLRNVQDLAQNSIGGQRVMNPFLDRRDAGARQAAEQFAEQFAPQGRGAAMIPAGIQEAAQAEVAAAYRARSEAVAPLYAQAAQDAAQPGVRGAVRGIVFAGMTRLEQAAARDQSGILRPQFEQMAERFRAPFDPANPQPMDWDSINDARRYIRDVMRAQGQPGQPVVDRKVAGEALRVIEQMTDQLKRAVPSLAAADREYIRLTQEVVAPVERGIIGRVSETDNAQSQRALLFPRSPMGGAVPTTPEAAGEAFGRLAGPQATRARVGTGDLDNARGLLGAELRARLDEALALRASGPTERAGAASIARIAPTQRR